jgi:hypothetical protein
LTWTSRRLVRRDGAIEVLWFYFAACGFTGADVIGEARLRYRPLPRRPARGESADSADLEVQQKRSKLVAARQTRQIALRMAREEATMAASFWHGLTTAQERMPCHDSNRHGWWIVGENEAVSNVTIMPPWTEMLGLVFSLLYPSLGLSLWYS